MKTDSILLVLSGSIKSCQTAFEQALKVAEQKSAVLHVLTALPQLKLSLTDNCALPSEDIIQQTLTEQFERETSEFLNTHAYHVSTQHAVKFGHSYLEAIEYCFSHDIDLVIKQARSPDWIGHLFDSEDLHLLRKCPKPVWLVPPQNSPQYRQILLAIDFEHVDEAPESKNLNKTMLLAAAQLAVDTGASLTLINVYNSSLMGFASLWASDPEKLEQQALQEEYLTRQSQMRDLVDEVQADPRYSQLSIKNLVTQGDPKHVIAQQVKVMDVDLLVMGTLGRSGIPGMIIGNTAETVLLQVDCAVLAFKPEGFKIRSIG